MYAADVKRSTKNIGNDRSPVRTASIMFRDTIFYNAQRQVTLIRPKIKHSRYYAISAYLQALKRSELNWPRKPGRTIVSNPQGQLTP